LVDIAKEKVLEMLGISSSWMATRGFGIKESIEKEFGMGFELVEVGAAHRYEEKAIDAVLDVRKRFPGKKFTVHGAFPPVKPRNHNGNGHPTGACTPSDRMTVVPKRRGGRRKMEMHRAFNLADPREHDAVLKSAKKMFDVAYRLNSDVIGIHGGFMGEVEFVDTGKGDGFDDLVMKRPITRQQAQDSTMLIMQELVNMAEMKAIRLAIEIHNPMPACPMMDGPQAFDWLFSTFKSKYLGLLLDLGHLQLASRQCGFDPCGFTKRFKDKVFEIHLHDVKGEDDHRAAGTGEVDFAGHFDMLGRKVLEKTPMIFEYKNNVGDEEALKGKAFIENLLVNTK
jgi:sugar phosphate isomerase/epimerase